MSTEDSCDPYKAFAEFYDLYVGDWAGDLRFYLEFAAPAGRPVLEVAAGTGRLTIPLARAGVSIVAVDVSSSMLRILESRLALEPVEVRQRIRIVEADASALRLGEEYDLIIVPFYTFNYFVTAHRQRAALGAFSSHLSRGGRALIDVFIALPHIKECPSEPVLRVDTVDPRTGNRVRGWNVYTMDTVAQIETRRHIFEATQGDGTVVRREFQTRRRYFFADELDQLFADNGFTVEAVFTGYEKAPPKPDSEQLVYVLRQQ